MHMSLTLFIIITVTLLSILSSFVYLLNYEFPFLIPYILIALRCLGTCMLSLITISLHSETLHRCTALKWFFLSKGMSERVFKYIITIITFWMGGLLDILFTIALIGRTYLVYGIIGFYALGVYVLRINPKLIPYRDKRVRGFLYRSFTRMKQRKVIKFVFTYILVHASYWGILYVYAQQQLLSQNNTDVGANHTLA